MPVILENEIKHDANPTLGFTIPADFLADAEACFSAGVEAINAAMERLE